jgi:malonate transporter and related proteins
MTEAVMVLLPIVALIALGHLLKRGGFLGGEVWGGIEWLVYYLLFPALLFGTLAVRPINLGAGGAMVLTGFGFMLGGMLLGLAARPLLSPSPQAFASIFQCAFRFNTYIGFALMGGILGADGIAAFALLAGFVIPLANLASVWALARHGRQSLLRELVRNPLILATFSGIGWSLSGLPLPETALTILIFLGEPALPLGLLATGAGLTLLLNRRQITLVAYFLAVKLLAVPAFALALATALGLQGEYRIAALVLAALPSASSAYILATRMGGDGPLVATTVGAGTLAAGLTLPFWLGVLGL